jgi:exodeoxyribonuclease VII small subunit
MDQPRQTREVVSGARPDTGTEPIEAMGFDRVLQRLRMVVSQLETGQLSIEESLRVYEEGIALARRAHQVLDNAEKRVELLVRDSARNGEMSAAPFHEVPSGVSGGDEAGDGHGDSEPRG